MSTRETGKSAISPQVQGDAEATTSRPPILQTHGATLGHCVCRESKKKGEGIRVSHMDLPQGSLGNYREAE